MAATVIGPILLAPSASTGNNTHTGVNINPPDCANGFNFIVEAIGGTPTVTWKVQGCLDDKSVADASVNWVDIPYVTANSDTVATAALTTAVVGKTTIFLDINNGNRFFGRFRLVTTSNTNVTYRCEVFSLNAY